MVADDANRQRNQDDAQSDKNMPTKAEKECSPGNQRLPEMLVYQVTPPISLRTLPAFDVSQPQLYHADGQAIVIVNFKSQ